jgi:hypothetical protein
MTKLKTLSTNQKELREYLRKLLKINKKNVNEREVNINVDKGRNYNNKYDY